MSLAEQAAHARAVLKRTSPCAPLPDFSGLAQRFARSNRRRPGLISRLPLNSQRM
jgi:hypothetical protein